MSTLFSSAYLPCIRYFKEIVSTDAILIEQHENYVKQTYRNRCNILTANGTMPLIIPIERKHGEKINIKDVQIDYDTNWQTLHWRAINAAYRSSPFFEFYIDDFLPFYEKQEKFLFDFNYQLLEKCLELCSIRKDIIFTDKFETQPTIYKDVRKISPKDDISANYFKPYYQVFGSKLGFTPDLSVLDLLCNEGNNSWALIKDSITD